jgi:hypothetical protein
MVEAFQTCRYRSCRFCGLLSFAVSWSWVSIGKRAFGKIPTAELHFPRKTKSDGVLQKHGRRVPAWIGINRVCGVIFPYTYHDHVKTPDDEAQKPRSLFKPLNVFAEDSTGNPALDYAENTETMRGRYHRDVIEVELSEALDGDD